MLDFSIITVSYNSAETIKETISSVLGQVDVSFEYIIIDGASTDNTINIIESFNDPRIKILSEDDDGLYDAMNKGIALATGSIIAIINSDDVYISSDVLDKVKKEMTEKKADILSGHIYFFDHDINIKKRSYKCTPYINNKQWHHGWQPPHPSTFVRKAVYDAIGAYNIQYKISADYDFLFRALYINKYKHIVLNEYLVAMRNGGESTRNIKAIIKGNKEVNQVWSDNGIKKPKLLILNKLISKIVNNVYMKSDH